MRAIAAIPGFLLAALLALPALAALPPADFKAPPTGTRLQFADEDGGNRTEVVVQGREGLRLNWETQGRKLSNYTLFCWACGPDMTFDPKPLEDLFPLAVGKKAQLVRKRANREWTDQIEVIGTDTVSVPAGRFDVFVVRTRSKRSDNGWGGERINYFAPNLGWMVRQQTTATDLRQDAIRHLLSVDGETGIVASATAPSTIDQRNARLAAFIRPPAPPAAGRLTDIGAVTGVKTFAYGIAPGQDRSGMFPRSTLYADHILETVKGSALHAKFRDETDFRMSEESVVRVDRYVFDPDRGTGEMAVELGKGAFRFVSGRMPKGGVRIGTPDAIIGIRGTDFIVNIDNSSTRVSVLEGEVEITPRAGGAATTLTANQAATVNATGVNVQSAAAISIPAPLQDGGCGG